jgi:endogenous inhibitor of DNA gyrase (YacG/DUF329 family)
MPNKTSSSSIVKCAMCPEIVAAEWKPFCSKRCADLDLGKWFNGSYAIAGEPADQAEENPVSEKNAE